uniref:Uncharacterized protein n=1 Tax=Rhizophora mucronata TaxID=61149 RepID=A0A2P2QN46_RHIMU
MNFTGTKQSTPYNRVLLTR